MKRKLGLIAMCAALWLTGCGKGADTNMEPTASVREEVTVTPETMPTEEAKPTKRPAGAGSPQLLLGQLKLMKEQYADLSLYQNGDELQTAFDKADALVERGETEIVTQQEYNDMLQELRAVIAGLLNTDGIPDPSAFTESVEMPDPYTFLDGTKVTTEEEFDARLEEIRHMYECYVYGPMPDASEEEVTYTIVGTVMRVTVTCNGRTASYDVNLSLPTKQVYEEAPVLFVFGGIFQTAYANERGYAVLSVNPTELAVDMQTRSGAFYEVHPYGAKWTEQTGALTAWGWGISKAIDALENGAAKELGLTTTDFLLTGVSRYGKATAVTGALEERIKITAPSCSGAGGLALFRYMSEGNVYDYTEIGRGDSYKFGTNEPLSSIRGSSEGHWFNDNFQTFRDETVLPLEQYMLAALCGTKDRYLFISGSYCDEDWVNAPSMWMCYLAAKDLYDFMGISDHLAICLHEKGHMVTDQDLVYLLDYADHHLYGKEVESDLSDLTTSLYALSQNADPEFEEKLIFR